MQTRHVRSSLVVRRNGFDEGQRIAGAWPGAVMVETDGLGHNRPLRDPDVVARIAAFVAGEPL